MRNVSFSLPSRAGFGSRQRIEDIAITRRRSWSVVVDPSGSRTWGGQIGRTSIALAHTGVFMPFTNGDWDLSVGVVARVRATQPRVSWAAADLKTGAN